VDIDAIQVQDPDTVAPAAITNLAAVTGTTNGSVDLSWTAVGDDDNSGTASSYLVRYSTNAITASNWAGATPVTTGIPTPSVAGSTQSMMVNGLTPGVRYYFAILAQDENPNTGAISNSPSAVAKAPAPVGAGMYDDMHTAWSYSGDWTVYSGAGPANNSMHYTSTSGNYAELLFNGAKFTLTFTKNSNRGSIDVYVDGSKVTTINANQATLAWQSSYTSLSYTAGNHTVRLVHAGGGTYIDVDAITILP
jgi:hypothetical protein